jgi:hypothetical protein
MTGRLSRLGVLFGGAIVIRRHHLLFDQGPKIRSNRMGNIPEFPVLGASIRHSDKKAAVTFDYLNIMDHKAVVKGYGCVCPKPTISGYFPNANIGELHLSPPQLSGVQYRKFR